MALESAAFRPDKLLRDLSVVLSANVGIHAIEVLYDVDNNLPEVLAGDALRLQQVLINLAGNAVKFTLKGQVVISVRKLASTPSTVTVEFAVQDSGIGIAPENQKRIFSDFSQAEASTTRQFGGTGLGLAISKRLVELMGGQLQLASTLGQGSTFSFCLKLSLAQEVSESETTVSRKIPAPRRTLIVDDNPIARRIHASIVQSWGWPVDVASSGAEALQMVRSALDATPNAFPYALIFIDWKMPDMDGWETTRQLRQLSASVDEEGPTIIMVTAESRTILAERSADEQAMLGGFLVKPTTSSMLLDAVIDSEGGNPSIRSEKRSRKSKRQLMGMRILVVEDNLINQQVAEELLSAEGALVSLAANGQLGVEAVANAAPQFDVVLMDIQMPVLDGYGATRIIRERLGLKALPIIAMTANAMAGDREACLGAGMDEHIGKPYDMGQLVSLLIRVTGIELDIQAMASTAELHVPLPEIAGLDLTTALGRMSGMRKLYVRTARDFAKVLDSVILDLQRVLEAGDVMKSYALLHTLKGNAGTLGVIDLAREAARLEALCVSEAGLKTCLADLSQLNSLVRTSQAIIQEALLALSEGSSASAAKDQRPIAPSDFDAARNALHALLTLTTVGDLNALQRFAELHTDLSGLPAGQFEALEVALQNIDLDAATQACEQALSYLGTVRTDFM